MDKSSRNSKLQNALFEMETKENNFVFKRPICGLNTLIRIILADEPFEKTMHDIFYGIRCLFPYFCSPACSKTYNPNILEKTLRSSGDVKEVKLIDRRTQKPKNYYVFKKDVTFSYKIEDIIGTNQSLHAFTKISKDKFLNMLHREAKIGSYSSNSLRRNCNIKPLLELKHKFSLYKSKNIETPQCTRIIDKVPNIKLSRMPKKTPLFTPVDNWCNKQQKKSSQKYKWSIEDPLNKSEKTLDIDGAPNSNQSESKRNSKSESSYISVNDTKSPMSSGNLQDNIEAVHYLSESSQLSNSQNENNKKTISLSLNLIRKDFQHQQSLRLNSVNEGNCFKVNKVDSREAKSQHLRDDAQTLCSINKALNCYPNLPCSITVAGYEISIGVQTDKLTSSGNDRRSVHSPLRVDNEKLEKLDCRFQISKGVAVGKDFTRPDQLLIMHDAASRVSSCPSIPIRESSYSPPSIHLASEKRKEFNENISDLSSPSCLNTSNSNLKDACNMSGQSYSIGLSPTMDAPNSREILTETSAVISNKQSSNEGSCVKSSTSLNRSYSLPFSDTDVCSLLGEFNSMPNEVVMGTNHSSNICSLGLSVVEPPEEEDGSKVLSPKNPDRGKRSLTEMSSKHKSETDSFEYKRKMKKKKKRKKKAEHNDGKKKILPPIMKALDMPTLYEESVDYCNVYEGGIPVEKLLNIPMKLNFVKGSDLKCVHPETFQQLETADSFASEQLTEDETPQTEKNFQGLELPAKQLTSSKEVSSKSDKLFSRGSTNNRSLSNLQPPDVSITAVASAKSVMISEDSSPDLQQLLDQLNNNDSVLSKRLSVIYPEYLPAKKQSHVLGGSCGSGNAPCPFEENCPTHKRKSVEESPPNKVRKLDESTSQAQNNKDPQVEKQSEDSSLSLIVKDLSKDVIDFHVKRIKTLFKWMRYDETYHSFSCQDCSYEVGDSNYEMGIVKVMHSVGDFRLNYFYDLCKEHSTSHFHCISVILKKNPRKFNAIKFILMNCLQNFLSLDELLKEILSIFKECGNPEWKGALINLIELVRSLNERQILFVVRQLNLPVSFVLNFCKSIAIMRFVLLTGEPIEYALVIGNLSVKSFQCFLQAISVSVANVIFFKVLDKCGGCSNCDFTSNREVGSPLPLRFPSVKELLLLIQKDNRLGNIFKFSKGIFLLYQEFPQKFRDIEGVHVLEKFQTCLWPALEFTLKEQEKLKEACLNIFTSKGSITALGLAKYPLHLEGDVSMFLKKIKTTCVEVRSLTKRCEVETCFIDQLPSSFKSLFNNVSNCSDVDEKVRRDLSNFVLENSRKECCGGRQHVTDFEFLSYPSTLMNLNNCPKSVDTFKKIYTLAKPFVKEEPQKVLEELQLFGKFLFDTFDSYSVLLNDILKVFHTHEFVRQNFPLSHTFYYVVGTLPFFPAYVERSVYYIWDTCNNFTEKFGKGIGFNLAMIYFQQQNLPLVQSNLTAYCMKSFIENVKIQEKIKI